MTPESDTLARLLTGITGVVRDAPRPTNPTDAEDVLVPLHQLMTRTEGLHDQIVGCYGPVHHGRCADCGRLVDRTMWRAHEPGGCLYAIPLVGTAVWLVHHRDAIPLIGQLIWRYRRRSAAHPVPASSEPPSVRGGDQ